MMALKSAVSDIEYTLSENEERPDQADLRIRTA